MKPVVIAARQWCGLFSMVFQAIGMARVVEEAGGTPIVLYGKDCCFWGEEGYHGRRCAWDYFFKPVAGATVEDLGLSTEEAVRMDLAALRARLDGIATVTAEYPWETVGAFGMPGKMTEQQFRRLLACAARHLQLRSEPVKKGLSLCDALLGDALIVNALCIGVHFRGNDKWVEAPPANPEAYWRAIDAEVARGTERVFVATDSKWFAEAAAARYPGVVAMSKDVLRADGPVGVHFTGGIRAAEEALIDAFVLSRCDKLYHGYSNLAGGVACLNPVIERVNLSE